MDKEERKYIFAQLRSLPNATQYVEVTKYIDNLEQQCKKQKEVIDKANEFLKHSIKYREDEDIYQFIDIRYGILEPLLYILKEVDYD